MSSINSELDGGVHAHAELLLSDVDNNTLAPGAPFAMAVNPGVYHGGIIPVAQQSQREAEHKELMKQFQMCVGVVNFLLELCAEQLGYSNVTPFQMITHFPNLWVALDFVDINALMENVIQGGAWPKYPPNISIKMTRLGVGGSCCV